jgi:hypothetical protein
VKQLNLDLGEKSPFAGEPISVRRDEPYYPTFTYSGDEELELPKSGKMLIEYKESRREETEDDRGERYTCTIQVRKIISVEGAKEEKDVRADDALDAIRDALAKSEDKD